VFESLSLRKPAEKEQVLSVRLTRLLDEHLQIAIVSVIHAHDRRSKRMVPSVDRPPTRDTPELHHGCHGPDPTYGAWQVPMIIVTLDRRPGVRTNPYVSTQ
jgi:hypothetical protein